MEIFGKVVDTSGKPMPGAHIQRKYPNGAVYSDTLYADANGVFNGRVPDGTYSWTLWAPGYQQAHVPLAGLPSYNENNPIIVKLLKEGEPASAAGGSGIETWHMILGAGALAALAIYKKWIRL